MEKITCNELWRGWMISSPEDYMVICAKEKISKYSKDDWKLMSEEATYMTKMLGELVFYDIPYEAKLAENGFDELINHFHKWFFPINRSYLSTLAAASGHNNSYSTFFDQFYPGLGKYLSGLIPFYLYKIKD